MSTKAVRRRPTKRDLIAQVRIAEEPQPDNTVKATAPPEPVEAEIAEALEQLGSHTDEAETDDVMESLHSPIFEDDGDDFPLDDEIGEPEDEQDDEPGDEPEETEVV